MKRPISSPHGRLVPSPSQRIAVSRSGASVVADLLGGGCRGLEDLESVPTDDASLIADFAEFISAGEIEGREAEPAAAPDPDFRERLRRRLWRRLVHAHLRDLGRSH